MMSHGPPGRRRRYVADDDVLTVADLRGRREAQASVNHETYKLLLRQVQDRIRARAAADARDMAWQVPPLVPGRPVYRGSHAARYVSEKLRRGGFGVLVAEPVPGAHVLYVTWDPTPPRASRGRSSRRPSDRSSRGPGDRSSHGPGDRSSRGPGDRAGLPISVAEAGRRVDVLRARLAL